MRQSKSARVCVDVALTNAYGEDDDAAAWLTGIETMFFRCKQFKLLGKDVTLIDFDLHRYFVVAKRHKGQRKVHATLDSIEVPGLTPVERR